VRRGGYVPRSIVTTGRRAAVGKEFSVKKKLQNPVRRWGRKKTPPQGERKEDENKRGIGTKFRKKE